MATNSPGDGKEIISAGIRADIAAYIERRSKRLDKAKAWGVGRIIDLWIAAGAPPLSELDEKLEPIPFTGSPAIVATQSVEKMAEAAKKRKRRDS